MHCPFCRHPDSRVIDSRTSDDGLSIRRRRQCPECGGRFSTIETASLNVIKRSGVIEPFSREKVMSGVRKACQGRPVTEGDLAVLAQRVEETVRQTGASQIDTNEIGLAILGPLRELDEVAYLRFASVYQAFDSLEDFESAIAQLRADHARRAADAAASADDARGRGTGSLEGMYPLLFRTVLSRMDPETAHHAAMAVIRVLGVPPFSWAARALTRPDRPRDVGARARFDSPFGVAAGFDKDVKGAAGCFALGFGHVEVGTLTAVPQDGNPRPRLFRLIPDRAVVNRMGFNNHGAEAAAARLREAPPARAARP